MKESCIGGNQTLIADDQAAEVSQPREGMLHDPAAAVTPQLAPISRRCVKNFSISPGKPLTCSGSH